MEVQYTPAGYATFGTILRKSVEVDQRFVQPPTFAQTLSKFGGGSEYFSVTITPDGCIIFGQVL